MYKAIRTYGTWPSPISIGTMTSGVRLEDVQWDSDGETLVWAESEAGKTVLLAQDGTAAPRHLTDGSLAVRGGVGYGGGTFTVHDGVVIFAGPEGRLYRVSLDGGVPRPITPAFGASAAPSVSPDGHWIAFVHSYEGKDGLALVDISGAMWPQKLIYGMDFVMQPTWHPERRYLAFIAWHHPQMPWDGTELHLVTLEDDASGKPTVADLQVIAGDQDTAIFQPSFSPDGRYLAYISDTSGYGQVYVYDLANQTHRQITKAQAEHAIPAWIQGMRTYGWTPDSKQVYAIRNTSGFQSVHVYSVGQDEAADVLALSHYTSVSQLHISARGVLAFVGAASTMPSRIVTFDPADGQETVRRRSRAENLFPAELATPHEFEWATDDDDKAYGLYYPPMNGRYQGEGAPPVIAMIHGGPTSQAMATFDLDAQFFATRGYGVLMVNHRGSTGYGRDYMLKLRGTWGVVDVADSANGVLALVAQGMADRDRLVIMGGSAGGYTVLQSLINRPGVYRAGISRYGVANLFSLAQETHKFEERYTDSLVGPLPEASARYRDRSPVFHADRIQDALLLFQGTDDKVVPKNQSDELVAALKANGVTHEYHVYEGEGHGFRQPASIQHYYESIVAFLSRNVVYA